MKSMVSARTLAKLERQLNLERVTCAALADKLSAEMLRADEAERRLIALKKDIGQRALDRNNAGQIGDPGTEQFSIRTYVDDALIGERLVHDPLVHNTTVLKQTRRTHLKGIFVPSEIRVRVVVGGSAGAERAIMTLDPKQMARDTEEILQARGAAMGGVGACRGTNLLKRLTRW